MSDQSSRKPHQCDNCTKSFASSHQLAQHIRIHSGDKPYKCSYCDKNFKQLSHVQQHTRLHTGERPYKCSNPDCGRSFIQLSNLQQHMRTHVTGIEKPEREEKRYVASSSCPVCGKSYVNEGSLRKHIQTTHANVVHSSAFMDNLQVNSQAEVFGQLNGGDSLNTSAAAAIGLLACTVCKQMFTNKDDLLQHMEDLRTDPKHQFEAQILLSCAAAERKAQQQSGSLSQNDANSSVNNLNHVENLLIMNNVNNVQDNMQKYVFYYVQQK